MENDSNRGVGVGGVNLGGGEIGRPKSVGHGL